jgi:cell division protein FtsN
VKFFIGLILGIAIAGGIAFYLNKAQNPFVDKGFSSKTLNDPLTANTTSSAPIILAPGTKMQTMASAPVAAKPAASAPTYDFYDVLQGKKSLANHPSQGASQPAKISGFVVQAGAFSDPDLANNMKAKLTLLGFNAHIESEQNGDNIINKVILGPYSARSEAVTTLNQLKQQDISATIINLN